MPSKEDLLAAFRCFDRNGDGVITLQELFSILCHYGAGGNPLPVEQATRMFRDADKDGDGVVSFEEFAPLWFVLSTLCHHSPRPYTSALSPTFRSHL